VVGQNHISWHSLDFLLFLITDFFLGLILSFSSSCLPVGWSGRKALFLTWKPAAFGQNEFKF
jgi:hypothetical protein